ncbi:DUF6599 family protein [Candidatus Latescibacterota bacterium]
MNLLCLNRIKFSVAFTVFIILFCAVVTAQSTEKQLLPESFEGGFKLTKPVAFYDPGNLFELINGQAVFYLSYGFERLEHSFYAKDGNEFTVDVYRLRDRLSAMGSYRQQKDDDAKKLDVGCEGYAIDYLSVFYKSNYYIELIPSDPENKNNIALLTELAKQIETVIPGTTDLPPEIALFPKENMIPDSEMYTGENLLSYTFLGHGLTAEYTQNDGDRNLRVFISLAGNEANANNILKVFSEKLESSDSVRLSNNVRGVKGELPYRGNTMAFSYKEYAVGCLGYTDEKGALKLFNALLTNLK